MGTLGLAWFPSFPRRLLVDYTDCNRRTDCAWTQNSVTVSLKTILFYLILDPSPFGEGKAEFLEILLINFSFSLEGHDVIFQSILPLDVSIPFGAKKNISIVDVPEVKLINFCFLGNSFQLELT